METTTVKKILPARDGYKIYKGKGDTSTRWFVYYYVQLSDLVHKRVKVYGGINRHSTAEGRIKAANDIIKQLEAGTWNDTFEAVNLSAALHAIYTDRCRTLRKKSRETYYSKLEAFLQYCGKKRVDEWRHITPKFATGFLNQLNRNNTTINSYRDTLRTFFESARDRKLIDENPFKGIDKLPEARKGKIYFNSRQIEQLKPIIADRHPVLWMACLLEYYCFIRPNEVRFLKVEHVNFDENFIRIPGDISKNKKTQVVGIPGAFKPLLQQWIDTLPENFYILNRAPVHLGNNCLNKAHKKILVQFGYSARYSLYSWKHTGAVACVKAGISLKDLQMQMRHHSLDQLNEYLRELGVMESEDIKNRFPEL